MGLHLHLRLCPSMICLFFFLINIILVHVPTPVSGIDVTFQNCSAPFHCANTHNIGYPFWGGNRLDFCGYPGFELNCEGDFPEIKILNRTYKLLNINNVSQAITVAREDYWDDTCPSNFLNTTLNFTLFNYATSTDNLTLYYSCPVDKFMNNISVLLNPYQFGCNQDETNTNYFYSWGVNIFNTSLTEAIKAYLASCANIVEIPLQKPTLESMVNNPGSVNLSRALQEGFGLQWFANNGLCEECEQSKGQCGYADRIGQFNCYCSDTVYPDSCPSDKGSFNLNLAQKVAIGAMAGVVGIVAVSALFYMHRKNIFFRKKLSQNDQDVEAVIRKYGSLAPKRYNYSVVKKMTKSFTDKIGQGGYGVVYRGKLHDGRVVAVKILSDQSKGNGEEFINEVACISGTSHVNIVTLLGFCSEGNKRALIYEFMSNGSLDKFIHDKGSLSTNNNHLEWETLSQIVVGVARGLEYLHRGCNTRIVHFDIKPHNILLDEDFCPKISDFGLAKLCKKKESIISMLDARGTIGYIAPEVFCRNFGGVSHKSDVYGFGMMILEMLGVRNNSIASGVTNASSEMYFPEWIYKLLEPGEDLTLHGIVSEEEEVIARKMIIVSLWCIQINPSDRPSMSKAVEMLEGGLESLQVPPNPFLNSSFRISIQHSSMTTTSLS